MSFLYTIFLRFLYPTSLCALLVFVAAVFPKRERLRRVCLWTAFAVLMICGNGWLVGGLTKQLEWKYLPSDPVPIADCILVLSGGVDSQIPPRPTIEIGEAGDRILYSAHLYRNGKAPLIICAGGSGTGGIRPRSYAEDMAELLQTLNVPQEVIILETKSENTHEHSQNLMPIFQQRGFKKILLVTSAMHMTRSIGVFKKQCPGIEFIPAPTDFRCTEKQTITPWYRKLVAAIPTPKNLLNFSEVMHEYLGIAYYKMRGWL